MIDVAALEQSVQSQGESQVVAMPRHVFDSILVDLKAGQRCAAALVNARTIMTSALTAKVA